jgi:hypothetical protein
MQNMFNRHTKYECKMIVSLIQYFMSGRINKLYQADKYLIDFGTPFAFYSIDG